MTDANLMDAMCKHERHWDECAICNALTTLELEIVRLVDFNHRLLEVLSNMTGVGRGFPLTKFSINDVDPEIVGLLREGGRLEC